MGEDVPVEAIGDRDVDGLIDGKDNCPSIRNNDQADEDKDGIGNACDNCSTTENTDQVDSDSDGEGDACEEIVCGIVPPTHKHKEKKHEAVSRDTKK